MAGVEFWDVALSAIALMLVFEGLLPFLSPRRGAASSSSALQLSDGQIRFLGLVSISGAAVGDACSRSGPDGGPGAGRCAAEPRGPGAPDPVQFRF